MPEAMAMAQNMNSKVADVFQRYRDILVAIFVIASMLLSWVLLDLPLSHPYRLWQASMALLVLSGIFLTGERYHHWLPWIFLAVLIASQVLFRSRPGAFLAT